MTIAATECDALAVRELLAQYHFRFSTERELQEGIATALTEAGMEFVREAPVTGGRIDFLVDGGTGIEVKVNGSRAMLLRQIHAYLGDPQVQQLLVVTSKAAHREIPTVLHGKRALVLWLSESR